MSDNPISSYLDLLPVSFTYQDDNLNQDLAGFLSIFEALLTRKESLPQEFGMEGLISYGRIVDNASRYSDPDQIPLSLFDDLGPWMARCLGVMPQQDWSYFQLKQMIKQIIPIYRIRTTKSGMEALFTILTTYPAQVIEILGSFGIGFYRKPITDNPKIFFCSGRIGEVAGQSKKENMIPGGRMFGCFFIINLTISVSGPYPERQKSLFKRVSNIISCINAEKPVQTQYQLNYTTTPLEVGARGSCTVGVNTSLTLQKETHTINSWCEDIPAELSKQIYTQQPQRLQENPS
ncbi:hypothetical protein BTA51_09370 [Hahella sp. CCB-MM4]|uniref:hypothetical protein n=1 Tax=Hahella sp. (strain CCB-MM4) TaxID=1926491 RepID=UPI000B9AD19C|nr:hypothetical protein [Hahella sp. CCB-MM4]OZG73979.1 hypothetical protein BTA51_09370 [Hahella sp. CCB-MM4]